MPRIIPKPGAAALSLIPGIFLEGIELLIRQRFAHNSDQPHSRANFFQDAQRRARIQARQQKRHREHDIQQRLKFKEEEEAQRQVGFPVLAQLHVASLFGMPDNAREKKIARQSQSPKTRHRGHGPFPRMIPRRGHRVVNSKKAESERPADVHNGRIADQQMDDPQHQHHPGNNRGSGQCEVQGCCKYHAVSAVRTTCRRSTRRKSGERSAYASATKTGAIRLHTTMACHVVVQSTRIAPHIFARIIA